MKHFPFLMLLLFLICSCSKDKDSAGTPDSMEEMEEVMIPSYDISFNSEGRIPFSTSFIVLSDNSGKTLYDTIGTNLDIDISLELDTEMDISATVGSVSEDEFEIFSYSKVQSGAQLNLSLDWETDACFRSDPVDGGRATLKVVDLEAFYETINAIDGSVSESLDLVEDTLVLEGIILSRNPGATQIAIREREDSELLSIVIPQEDWKFDNDTQSREHTVSFKDFTSTDEYVIDLNRTDRWVLEMLLCNEEGKKVALQSQTGHGRISESNQVKFYVNEALDFTDIKFNLANTTFPAAYSYNWIYDNIPDAIHLDVDIEPTFTRLEADAFTIRSTFNYNLNVLSYYYLGNYSWTILSQGGVDVSFQQPSLPSELFEAYPNLEETLKSPLGIRNYLYRTGEALDDVSKVHKAVIPRNSNNTPDYNYSRRESRVTF